MNEYDNTNDDRLRRHRSRDVQHPENGDGVVRESSDEASRRLGDDDRHSREECIETEAWLTEDGEKVNSHAIDHGYNERFRCPKCGREYSYVYSLIGLWSEDDEEYVWED